MSSLIEGYNYDIFISYRQKDNKGYHWVSEFVEALKTELESTFKEEISVYFDINPNDGLLETHDVDASLKEKLRCLIFIPIISRTYCDPKSFAWELEFMSFVEMASKDQYGLKVKLPNGNVAGRVLPVRIHELSADDIELVKSHIGHIRSVDFIYKSTGVNRPLQINEDHPHDNLNKTYYRDQINKVANAIDEIITGIRNSDQGKPPKPKHERPASEPGPETVRKKPDSKSRRKVVSLGSTGIVLLILALYFFSSGSTLPFEKRQWVLITDFENMTGETLFDKSLYTAFSLSIGQSRYINIFSHSRIAEAIGRMELNDEIVIDDKIGSEIAVREGIPVYIVPNISKVGEKYVLTARILETKTRNILKSEIVHVDSKDHILESIDKLSRTLRRSFGESRYWIARQDKPLSKVTTSSLEALKQYSLGIESHWKLDYKNARSYYENALRLDTGFIAAKASLGNILLEIFDEKEGENLLAEAVRSIDNVTDKEKYGILAFYNVKVEKNLASGIENARILTGLYPDDPAYHNNLGYYFQLNKEFDEALKEYKTTVGLDPTKTLTYGGIVNLYLSNLGLIDSAAVWSRKMIRYNPRNAWGYLNLGSVLVCKDSLQASVEAFLKARELNPSFTMNLYRLAYSYRLMGQFRESNIILENISNINKEDIAVYYETGLNYLLMNDSENARNHFTVFRQKAGDIWLKQYPGMAQTFITLGAAEARLNNIDTSNQMLKKAMAIDSTLHIRYAELYCSQDDIKSAVFQVHRALQKGYRDIYWLKAAPDLLLLWNDPDFRKLIAEYFEN